jgi:polysaccharide deacetylase 2 family uncharacterized protein YibQ
MLRGILTGLIWGGLLGFVIAGVVSLLSPLPSTIETQTSAEPVASQPQVAETQGLDTRSAMDAPVTADSTAQSPQKVDGADSAPLADVQPAPKPTPSDVASPQAAPQGEGAGGVTVEAVSPVLPNPQARAIEVPGTASEPSISADPAQPPRPEAPETQAFTSPEVTDTATLEVTPEAETPRADAPAGTVADAATDDVPTVAPTAPPVMAPKEETPVAEAEVLAEPEETETAALAEAPQSRLKPATDLSDVFPQKTSTRLPTIGGETPAAPDAVEEEAPKSASFVRPIEAHAATFSNVENKPVLSVILMDDPAASVDLETLRDFPVPLSFAIDASTEGAADRMALYRDMGLETLAIVNLPTGAAASDVEVNLAAQLANVPESVALLEGYGGGLQESRTVSDQVIAYTLASGHGLVMLPKGLNTAQKMAEREGVPSITVFRDFDGKDQSVAVMRRFLDQAAFKARQVDGVVMLGRLRPDTINALAVWALQDRASTVAVAPISAVLLTP